MEALSIALAEKHTLLGKGIKAIFEDVYNAVRMNGLKIENDLVELGVSRSTLRNYQLGGLALSKGADINWPAGALYKIGRDISSGKSLEEAEIDWQRLVEAKRKKKTSARVQAENESLEDSLSLVEIPTATLDAYYALCERVIDAVGAPGKPEALGSVIESVSGLPETTFRLLVGGE